MNEVNITKLVNNTYKVLKTLPITVTVRNEPSYIIISPKDFKRLACQFKEGCPSFAFQKYEISSVKLARKWEYYLCPDHVIHYSNNADLTVQMADR